MKTTLHNFTRTLAFLLLIVSGTASAQVTLPHYDGLDYTVGQGLQTQTSWTLLNTGDPLVIASGSLSHIGLPTSTGNKVTMDGAGIDTAKLFTQQTSGTVYYSFLINVTSLGSLNATGGYMAGFTEGTGTNFGATVWLKSDGAGYDIGISPRTAVAQTVWSSGTLPINTTMFVVIAYTMNPGAGNDVSRLWINPNVGEAEPTATLTTTLFGTDLANVNRILLRQDSNTTTPVLEMDEFRIGTSWNDVNPAPAGALTALPASLDDFGAVNVTSTSTSQEFEVTGSDLGANDVVITAPSTDFQVSLNDASWFNSVNITPVDGTVDPTPVYVRFSPQSAGAKSGNVTVATLVAPTQNVAVEGEGVALASTTSDIIATPLFGYSSNIDYTLYQDVDITDANSLVAAAFTIRDGGAASPDGDALGTELTSVTIGITNPGNLRTVAIYDGATELGEFAAASSIMFPLSLTADDDDTKDFTIRVTYDAIVTDNVQSIFTITAASANVAASTFADANAGGAVSASNDDVNRVEVTASQLLFFANATNTAANAAMAPAVVVRAVDANNSVDLDFVQDISISSTGTLTGDPVIVTAAAGSASFATLTHTAAAIDRQLTASASGVTSVDSALFNITSSLFRNDIAGSSMANPYTAGQVVASGITVSGIGAGAGIVLQSTAGRYNANSWNTAALDPTAYFTFTITPVPGNMIDFSSFVYTGQASGTGPTSFAMRSSLDGFTADLGALVATGATIDLSAAGFQDVVTAIEFRIYGWNASAVGGTFSINDFNFYGVVEENTEPTISATDIASLFSYSMGNGPSSAAVTNVTAAFLTPAAGDITVTAPENFEVSVNGDPYADSTLIAYTDGTITDFPVSVRLKAGLANDTYGGDVVFSGGGAEAFLVAVDGLVSLPLQLSYRNSLRTAPEYAAAVADAFMFNLAPLNGSYVSISNGGYIETPVINFLEYGSLTVAFSAATFGGNTGQTLTLEISTDGGQNYTPLGTFAPNNGSTYIPYATAIDLSLYPSANGKLRIRMSAGTNQTRFRDLAILSTTTWDGVSWSSGEPNLDTAAIIAGSYNGTGELEANTLAVTTGTVIFEPGSSLTLQNELGITGGSVTFQNNANLIQINPVSNVGPITVEREAFIKRLDYVFWSSPVSSQVLGDFSLETLPGRFYRLDEPTNAFVAVDETITTFTTGRGYMIRAPNNYTTTPQTFTGIFDGTPRNGNFSVGVTHSVAPGLGYNLMGNPYPSPISAASFLSANTTVGTIYFWTHMNAAGDGVNYASFNGTGEASASGSEEPNGIIQTGQGFLVNVPVETTNIVFNNGMRINNHDNQFFRTSNTDEKHRIWLRLSTSAAQYNQALVGYISGATNDVDTQFDGKMAGLADTSLYSIVAGTEYAIQGKALPFQVTDSILLGFKAAEAGNYTIAVDKLDGLFTDGQDVFLKDMFTGTIHNIKESAYTFASAAGTFNNRFSVVYQNVTLGVDNPEAESNRVVVYNTNAGLNINSGSLMMSAVEVYDVRGSLIYTQQADNVNQLHLNGLQASGQLLILKIKTTDNKSIIKKAAY